MPDDDSFLSATGVGGFAVVAGVACCVGLKLIGGAALFGGLAAVIGISTDQFTFLLGGVGGLLLAVLAYGYRQDRFEMPG